MGCAWLQCNALDRGQDMASAAVRRALEVGIVNFDTAANYGDSEQTLGVALAAAAELAAPLGAQLRVHTKTAGNEPRFDGIADGCSAEAAVVTHECSTALLKQPITTIRVHVAEGDYVIKYRYSSKRARKQL
jgi:diketogulonate reductase-like aldo/keto reductase